MGWDWLAQLDAEAVERGEALRPLLDQYGEEVYEDVVTDEEPRVERVPQWLQTV